MKASITTSIATLAITCLAGSANGVKQLDISGNFSDGRLAFYNFSQANVRYSAFDIDTGNFPPAKGVPEPRVALLLAMALAGLAATRRGRVRRAG
jgi:hypothetical protein